MSNGISYSRELVEAAKQYARDYRRMTAEQCEVLRRFAPDFDYFKASAEILLNLLEGAEVHEARSKAEANMRKMAEEQKPVPPEIAKVIAENFDELTTPTMPCVGTEMLGCTEACFSCPDALACHHAQPKPKTCGECASYRTGAMSCVKNWNPWGGECRACQDFQPRDGKGE